MSRFYFGLSDILFDSLIHTFGSVLFNSYFFAIIIKPASLSLLFENQKQFGMWLVLFLAWLDFSTLAKVLSMYPKFLSRNKNQMVFCSVIQGKPKCKRKISVNCYLSDILFQKLFRHNVRKKCIDLNRTITQHKFFSMDKICLTINVRYL